VRKTPDALFMHSRRDKALGYFHFELRFKGATLGQLEQRVKVWLGDEEQQKAIVSFHLDGENTVVASINVTDIGFAHRLRNKVLIDGKGLENLGDGVELDMTPFIEHYEQCVLSLNKLTAHQLDKLGDCRGKPFVHLRAPAGAGKTFVALFRIMDELGAGNRVLYVCKNESLAISLVRWIVVRKRSEGNARVPLEKYLENFYVQFKPLEEGIRRVSIKDEKVEFQESDREMTDAMKLLVVDDAHNLYDDQDEMIKMENVTGKYEKDPKPNWLLLSDISQSTTMAGEEIQYPKLNFDKVNLTEVVRNSERIMLASLLWRRESEEKGVEITSYLKDAEAS